MKVGEATLRRIRSSPAEVSPGFRGKPEHDPRLCIACAACAVACPSNALTMLTDMDQGTHHLVHFLWALHLLRPL